MTIKKDLLYWHTDRKADMHIQWTLWFHIHAEYQRKEYKHSTKSQTRISTSNTKKSNQNMTIRKDLLYWHTDRKADMHIQ